MNGLARRTGELYGQSEGVLGRSWPLWVVALVFYAGAAFVVLTRVRLPTPLHLVVFLMAAVILLLTLIRVEWAVMALALMIPFARPGFTLGSAKAFHVSGFNVAVAGVWIVYTFRYLLERGSAGRGPFIRRTPLDLLIGAFVFLVAASTFVGLSNMQDPFGRGAILLTLKETLFYFAWLYLVCTLIRNPVDLRRFAICFAMSGVLVAVLGLAARMQSAAISLGVSEAEVEGGVVGGRTEGGWFGLIHPNLFGAFLAVSMPLCFFAVDHLRRALHRALINAATLAGFVGLLFTYSRSAWIGILAGLASQAALHRPTLRRMAQFAVLFAVVAQVLALVTTGHGFVDLIQIRFEQLQRSGYSMRPMIFASSLQVMRRSPLVGVGGGAFSRYSAEAWEGQPLAHAHNVLMTFACEFGIPAAAVYTLLLVVVIVIASRNVKRLVRVPGYGFLAQGSLAGLIAVYMLAQFEHVFFSRDVGYAFYGVVAIVLVLERLYNEGALPPRADGAGEEKPGPWRGA